MTDPTEKTTKNEGNLFSAEVAAEHVDELLDYYDIDANDGGISAELSKRAHIKLVRHFMRGNLQIEKDENGRLFLLIHLRQKPIPKGIDSTLKLKPLSGKSKIAMKDCKETDDYGKVYAMIGTLAGLSPSQMQRIEGPDLGLFDELFAVFMAA